MGRSLPKIILGGFGAAPEASALAATGGEERTVRSADATDIGTLLAYSRKVMIVPGYGLAVAQAQHVAVELARALEARGVEVAYAIHPVAGRMPGHMNVLLAEADAPYEELEEMEQANDEFPSTDVALVVGANDVVNPAARDDPGQPDLWHADLERRQRGQCRVLEAKHAARVFRGGQCPPLRPENDPAFRGRKGVVDQALGRGKGQLSRVAGQAVSRASRRPGRQPGGQPTPTRTFGARTRIAVWAIGGCLAGPLFCTSSW